MVAACGPEADFLDLVVVCLDVPPLAVQLVDVESGVVEDFAGEVRRVQDMHLFLLSVLVDLGLFDNDEGERGRLFSRPYGALRDGLARAGNVLCKRLFDGRRARRAHDKVQAPFVERQHDGDGEEPAVEHGERGLDAPPGAGVDQLGDNVRLCPLGEYPRGRRAGRVGPRGGEQGRVRLGLARPVLVLGPDHVLALFLSIVRHVVDVDYVDHGLGHHSGAPHDLHLGVEHEVAPLLHLLGAYRAEQPKQPLVGRKPGLAPVLAL